MQQRVACLNPACGAHRDRALPHTERCFVCGSADYIDVPPNAADARASADADLEAAIDAEIDDTFAHLQYLLTVKLALRTRTGAAIRH